MPELERPKGIPPPIMLRGGRIGGRELREPRGLDGVEGVALGVLPLFSSGEAGVGEKAKREEEGTGSSPEVKGSGSGEGPCGAVITTTEVEEP